MTKALLAGVVALGIATTASAQGPSTSTSAHTLAKGTRVTATLTDSINSAKNKIGDKVSATITNDVKDANGNVVFPSGSKAELKIIDIAPADDQHKDGTLALQVNTVHANGQTYTVNTQTDSLATESRKPGWTSDKKKIGIGAAAGAVIGGLASGNLKGAVAGGIVGAAGGAVVAHEMNGKDVVMKAGSTVNFQMPEPVQVMVS